MSFKKIFMNSFVFTTTEENKLDLWYNLGVAYISKIFVFDNM